jgi:hypothetical protein
MYPVLLVRKKFEKLLFFCLAIWHGDPDYSQVHTYIKLCSSLTGCQEEKKSGVKGKQPTSGGLHDLLLRSIIMVLLKALARRRRLKCVYALSFRRRPRMIRWNRHFCGRKRNRRENG